MSIQKLKAYLANKSEKELTREITDLYQQFSGVKDFYNLQMRIICYSHRLKLVQYY